MSNNYKLYRIYLKTALAFSTLSHCIKEKKASVLVKGDSILSVGINGTPINAVNCDDLFSEYNEDEHSEFSYSWEIEPEVNAILQCAKNGKNCQDAILFSTAIPSPETVKLIAASGISEVYYIKQSEDEQYNKLVYKQCKTLNIHIEQIED